MTAISGEARESVVGCIINSLHARPWGGRRRGKIQNLMCWLDIMQVVAAWNGMAIGAFAVASRVLANETPPLGRSFPVDGCPPAEYLHCAVRVRTA